MTRWFYPDPLQAAWMAKHFGMRLQNAARFDLEYHHPFGFTADDAMTNIGDVLDRLYLHPDSVPLLSPRPGDVFTDGLGKPCRCAGVRNDRVMSEGVEGVEYEWVENVRVIERDGKPFFWPDGEPA